MGTLISIGFSTIILLVMYAFGLYTFRNLRWVLASLFWGAAAFGLSYLLERQAAKAEINLAVVVILILPVLQQVLTALGALAVTHWEKFDNLVDGAVYGFANGLGYAAAKAFELSLQNVNRIEPRAALEVLSTALTLGTASSIVGVVVTQFYFKHRKNRFITLFSGIGASVAYVALFNFLVIQKIGGEILPVAFGIGGVTLIGLYVTGQLRGALIRLNVERQRADSLLDIVIPIGIELTYEKNFQNLLENMLLKAQDFCRADGGVLYLKKGNLLEASVLRYDSLNLSAGGLSETKPDLPAIPLQDESGKPLSRNIIAAAAVGSKTINVEDSYESRQYDFSGARAFDEAHHYASASFLVLPLKNSKGETLGALQFVNALDSQKKNLTVFDANLQRLMESFSALAAAALDEYMHEQTLRREIQQLRIEIDQVKRGKEVAEITETSYFRGLQEKAQQLRNKENRAGQTLPPEEKKPDQ